MSYLQYTTDKGLSELIPAVQVSITEVELNWLLEGLEAMILPDRSKRIKRALKRGLDEIEDRKGVDDG
tara:strand:- start:6 stop:209 length:204 start_codon:yes stop_codon:yes gene_type:complete